ncbi:hypothetical protein Tco_0491836 [Tanacetum coccineum]
MSLLVKLTQHKGTDTSSPEGSVGAEYVLKDVFCSVGLVFLYEVEDVKVVRRAEDCSAPTSSPFLFPSNLLEVAILSKISFLEHHSGRGTPIPMEYPINKLIPRDQTSEDSLKGFASLATIPIPALARLAGRCCFSVSLALLMFLLLEAYGAG